MEKVTLALYAANVISVLLAVKTKQCYTGGFFVGLIIVLLAAAFVSHNYTIKRSR